MPSANGGEAEGGPPLGGGHGPDPQAGAGDDAERALRADEQLREVGTDGLAGEAAGAHVEPSASTTSRPTTMSSILP